jgi:putative tricarboxylic transport membrane protein
VGSLFDLPGHLLNGFLTALSPINLMFGLIGVTVGTAIGVIPGIGPALTISLLLPLTYGLDPTTAFIMFGGIYYGAMYGGSTTSILVKMPGEAASVVTSLDGFEMAKQGRAGPALATAAIGSFVAGTFATFMLMLLAPLLVNVALRFGPPEYFALMVLALTTVSGLSGGFAPRAMFSTMFGLGLGIVGIDLQSGQARLTLGIPSLLSGIDVVIAAVGFFAIGEVLWAASSRRRAAAGTNTPTQTIVSNVGSLKMTSDDWRRSWPAWIRGSFIGFFVGILPGAGATVASFLSYSAERNASRYPEEFGKGAIEGVAAPEAANNASAGGSIVPLLALGIPGGGTTAIMLAAFQLYGLQPGPLLFAEKPQLVWGLIASLYISNTLLLALNLPLVGIWIKLLQVPQPLLFGSVLAFAMVGVYTINHNSFDLVVVWVLGIVSFFMRRYDFPIAPVILGLVLGPLLEQEFRKSIAISVGNPMIFFTRPISLVILFIGTAVLLRAVRSPASKSSR